jgi:outer membrane protein TolC
MQIDLSMSTSLPKRLLTAAPSVTLGACTSVSVRAPDEPHVLSPWRGFATNETSSIHAHAGTDSTPVALQDEAPRAGTMTAQAAPRWKRARQITAEAGLDRGLRPSLELHARRALHSANGYGAGYTVTATVFHEVDVQSHLADIEAARKGDAEALHTDQDAARRPNRAAVAAQYWSHYRLHQLDALTSQQLGDGQEALVIVQERVREGVALHVTPPRRRHAWKRCVAAATVSCANAPSTNKC